jgi:hypothetical protein
MLRKLRPRSVFDVMAVIAFVVALAGGTAYAANTVRSGDIVDNEVFTTDVRDDTLGFGGLYAQDLGPGSVGSSEIANLSIQGQDIATDSIGSGAIRNGSLLDVDVAQNALFNFPATIGTIPANNCADRPVTGVTFAERDHLLLTPSHADAHGALLYDARWSTVGDTVIIHVCNFSNATVNDGTTHFNLLTFSR